MKTKRMMILALLAAACILFAFVSACAEDLDSEYVENEWNFVDQSMDISSGIPENATGVLARIRENGVLRVAIEPYFPPQEFMDESLPEGEQIVGPDVELARLIAEKMGVELQLVPMDFSLVLTSVNEGECDLAISALMYTPGRAVTNTFSKGYYYGEEDSSVGLLAQERNLANITSIADLSDKIIVAQSGSLHEALAAERILNYHEFRRLSTIQEVYLAVANSWADAAVVNVAAAKSYIESHPQQKLALVPGVRLELPQEMQGDRIAARKGELQLMYFVNGVIDETLSDGRYYEWIDTYQAYWDRINAE
ncbi:MAG: amino acid ABC transporter substrate-binding protein [Clostridia bacterium]|nr:amino acid ABC transporter substrate-binding protein [Clostridia bacterium]MBR0408642.1 amino acid ABC transporter substrate-binding protein [Clostridia bacterium]